ncbi:MAG: hypothetical protein EP330_29865 [Deltaproteobacteria bacterium]|nr:MAG: hypothetical protein EP330_29865 [Deltaproteobacteria bacterium]
MTTAEEKVNMPGIALIVLGAVTILVSLGRLVLSLLSLIPQLIETLDYGTDALIAFLIGAGLSVVVQVINSGISIIVGGLVAFGGVKLRSLQSPALVYAGSVLAMIPCCSGPCCCLGLPIGIWAIVTMQDEEVKAAFEG